MKNLLFLVVVFSIVSCGGADEKKEKSGKKQDEKEIEKDSAQVELKIDTLKIAPDYKNPYAADLNKKDKAILKEFFTDSLVAEIFALDAVFDSISTEKQMLIYYNELLRVKERLHSHLSDLSADPEFAKMVAVKQENVEKDEYYDEYRAIIDYMMVELENIDKYLHGMKFTCVAECTEPYYGLVLNDLKETATKSIGESDDKFINLIIETYTGEYEPDVMNAKWFHATWDYGGSSNLGDGFHLSFLKATDKLIEEKNIFEDYINWYREECFHDLAEWRSFQNDKDKILKELAKIMKEVNLTKEQKEAIKIRQKELNDHTENSNDENGIQLNCKTGDCTYG